MLQVKVDYRLGNTPRYYVAEENEKLMLIPPEVKKSVVFLFCNTINGKKIKGTAFFVSVEINKEKSISYLVTAKHVLNKIKESSIDEDKKVIIHINTVDGEVEPIDTYARQWKPHPNKSVDVAVLEFNPPKDKYDYVSTPSSTLVDDTIIKKEKINVGEEVFLTGLFYKHYGEKKNLPLIRVGNIAMMPDEKVEVGHGFGKMEAYLVDCRSIGGLSGSPVFLALGHMKLEENGISTRDNLVSYYWLGLMHGHFNVGEEMIDYRDD